MKTERRTWSPRVIPVVLGAAAGYAYYSFVGCIDGTCPITGNPWISTGYGAAIGFFVFPWTQLRRESDGKE